MNTSAFIYHPDCDHHNTGDTHPESPMRTQVIKDRVFESGLINALIEVKSKQVTREQLLGVHHADYIDHVERLSPIDKLIQADQDTVMSPSSLRAAYLAAGSGIQAVDGIMAGEFNNAFCAVRPPGHHAEPNATLGFCFFNNIAVAAQHALKKHKLRRVAIVDFDVHQCNGTIEMFGGRPDVLICTSFQHPLYPNSHWQEEHANVCLAPLDSNSNFNAMRQAWTEQWYDALMKHQPEMIFISAGFDAHIKDPLGQLNWRTEDYFWLTNQLTALANEICKGRIVSMLEGGYHLEALADSVEAHLCALLGVGYPVENPLKQ